MAITITAFAASPDKGRGLARDMPVRWALEEVGQLYAVRLVSFSEMKQPEHRALQPFGQIPTFEDDGVVLFESGAIVLHIAQTHAGLLPVEPRERAQALSWLFAALTTVEPPIIEREQAGYAERDQQWFADRQPLLDQRIRQRLAVVAEWLGDRDWLGPHFSAADLMLVTVLRRLHGSGLLDDYPSLVALVARGEARPAFRRAFAAQLAVFTKGQIG